MTWDQLMGKIREGLTESGARIQVLGDMLTTVSGDGNRSNKGQTDTVLITLTLAMSDLHSTVEHVVIGLDAVVETLREVAETQEVESE